MLIRSCARIPPAAESQRCSAVAENQPVHHEQNRMTTEVTFTGFAAHLREFISRSRQGHKTHPSNAERGARRAECDRSLLASTAPEFNELALALFRLQFEHNATYRLLCEARRITPDRISAWREIPAVPASAFKELELTSLAPNERTTVFLSSGTTEQKRSRHFHNAGSLAVYEASLLSWFERHLLADVHELIDEQLPGSLDKLPFLALTPPPDAAPNSSLVHMFDTVRREFGSRDSLFSGRLNSSGAWTLDIEAALFAIRKAMCANRPLALLGTAFNFIHLLDYFAANNMRYRLAHGSCVLETGGYKGQSREIPKNELHALITKYLGIAPERVVTEYGMSELSSQAYDCVVGEEVVQSPRSKVQGQPNTPSPLSTFPLTHSRVFHFPPWVRAQVISPETGTEVVEGESGLLRIFDLANVCSVMAIQTEDLAIKRGDGFELIGRAAQAEPRGCSLMSLNTKMGAQQ